MKGPQHQIRRQVLELEIEDQQTAWRIQAAAGSIYRRRLVPVIDQCLTEYCLTEDGLTESARPLHRIDSLVVDLGMMDAEHLEAELAAALAPRLRRALQGLPQDRGQRFDPRTENPSSGSLRTSKARGEPQRTPGETPDSRSSDSRPSDSRGVSSVLELLEMFVRMGRLPWWADASSPDVVDEAVGELLSAAPRRLADWLRRLATAPSRELLRRLVVHLGDERLAELVALLADDHASVPEALPQDTSVLLEAGSRMASGSDPIRFRHAVWDAVLRATAAAGVRDADLFWRMVLTRVTAETAVERRVLETESVPRGSLGLTPGFAGSESKPSATAREQTQRTAGQDTQQTVPRGSLTPGFGDSESKPSATGREQAQRAAGQDTQQRQVPAGSPRTVPSTFRTSKAGQDTQQRQVPAGSPRTVPSTFRTSKARCEPQRSPGGTDEVRPPTTSQPGVAASSSSFRSRARASVDQPAPPDLTWSDVDETYVYNAGLVLLWPFLGHFFEHLGLMEDRVSPPRSPQGDAAFRDEAARHRAVGLLQYPVTEDPSPPEYQVTLGKVLCGLKVKAPFDLGTPVSDTEAEECVRLLQAVIGHATILKNMSPEGFRGSFLVRQGVLSADGDTWLLRVERETYDVVVDRFPWSVSWIQLPWMEGPMRVEW